MYSLSFIVAALALPLSPSGAAPALPTAVQCEIDVLSTPQGIVLRPVVRSRTAVSGSYQLSVDTSGPAGRSAVSQGGDFSVRGGRSDGLSSVALGRSPGAVVVARMNLSWAGEHANCMRRIPM